MARLRPVGIPEQDKIEPHTKIIPDRVQKLMDLYAKNHVEYPCMAGLRHHNMPPTIKHSDSAVKG
jgi:hypothetical protein